VWDLLWTSAPAPRGHITIPRIIERLFFHEFAIYTIAGAELLISLLSSAYGMASWLELSTVFVLNCGWAGDL